MLRREPIEPIGTSGLPRCAVRVVASCCVGSTLLCSNINMSLCFLPCHLRPSSLLASDALSSWAFSQGFLGFWCCWQLPFRPHWWLCSLSLALRTHGFQFLCLLFCWTAQYPQGLDKHLSTYLVAPLFLSGSASSLKSEPNSRLHLDTLAGTLGTSDFLPTCLRTVFPTILAKAQI